MGSRNDTASTVSEDEYVFTTAEKKNVKSEVYPTATITIGKENVNFGLDTVNLGQQSI